MPFNNFLLIGYFSCSMFYKKLKKSHIGSQVVWVWAHCCTPGKADRCRELMVLRRLFLFAWEADRVVRRLGDKNQDSCALQHSDLSLLGSALLSLVWENQKKKKQPVMIGLKASACASVCTSLQQLLIHLAFPLRPALVSRQMTQFDMPLGWFMWIMFPCDHHCRKETISCYDFFFFFFLLIKSDNNLNIGRVYCKQAKTHYFC